MLMEGEIRVETSMCREVQINVTLRDEKWKGDCAQVNVYRIIL